jgi:ubiquinone/menaquinone biosynthesis C-methylase UbiE
MSYENGFVIDGNVYPYYSFCKPEQNVGWSDEMTNNLEEATRSHSIDVYNRKIALDGIKDKIAQAGANYIDIGCSSGYMLAEVVKRYPAAAIFGADYFDAGLLYCHRQLPQIPLFQVDLVKCCFQNELFDAITCLNVLEHILDDVGALRQLRRILKPKGKIVISVPLSPRLFDMYDEIHYHVRRYRLTELKQKVENAGLRVLHVTCIGAAVYPLFYFAKLLNKFRFGNLTYQEKQAMVFRQISKTKESVLMSKLFEIEYQIGRVCRYPFGIRGYVLATK